MTTGIHDKARAQARKELEKIRRKNEEGKLLARDVVDAAAHPDHPLHDRFEWDDSAAGDLWRLEQARTLIRCVVVEDARRGDYPAYVSLIEDRHEEGGGYRRIQDVLDSQVYVESLERTAKSELAAWTHRYRVLTGLVSAVSRAAGLDEDQEGKKKRA